MSDEPSEPVQVQVEGRWVGVDDLPAILVNQMIVQIHEGEIVLTFGYASPPAVVGATRLEEWVRENEFVRIRPIARIVVTPDKLREIAVVLDQTVRNYERHEARQTDEATEASS